MLKHPLAFLFALGLTLLLAPGCAGQDDAGRALMKAGFSDITFTDSGYAAVEWEGCGKGDNAYFKANAKNPAGQRVSGILVCCGALKACTIRF